MHNGPQISSSGEWGDAAAVEDNKGKLNYYCKYCKYKTRIISKIHKHHFNCNKKTLKLLEGKDYIVCKICNFHGKSLGGHLKKIHNLDKNIYCKLYDSKIISENSFKKYKLSSSNNSWLKKAKKEGKDLTEYWLKVSKGVKNAILSSPLEIKRRSELMKKLNKKQQLDPKFKKIVSDTAKKTSARRDVQLSRAANLKKWRDNNPEEFHKKCILKFSSSKHSIPEKELFKIISEISGFNFKFSQIVKSNSFISKSKRKQIDIADKKKRIYIEYDGIFHFEKKFKDNEEFESIVVKDKLLNDYIKKHNWTLIRISYDQFSYKKSNYGFSKECLKKLFEILNKNLRGVFKIGLAYGKY